MHMKINDTFVAYMETLLEIQAGHPPILFAELIFREFLYFVYVAYYPLV